MSIDIQIAADAEPPLSSVSSFLIGRDTEGHWLAVETHGRAGGFFNSQDAAERFAAFETARRKGAIVFSPDPLQLKMS
jgi:hypothetical protein